MKHFLLLPALLLAVAAGAQAPNQQKIIMHAEGQKTGKFKSGSNNGEQTYQIGLTSVTGGSIATTMMDYKAGDPAKPSTTASKNDNTLIITLPANQTVMTELTNAANTREILRISIDFTKPSANGNYTLLKRLILKDAIVTKLSGPSMDDKAAKVQTITCTFTYMDLKEETPTNHPTTQDGWDVKTNISN